MTIRSPSQFLIDTEHLVSSNTNNCPKSRHLITNILIRNHNDLSTFLDTKSHCCMLPSIMINSVVHIIFSMSGKDYHIFIVTDTALTNFSDLGYKITNFIRTHNIDILEIHLIEVCHIHSPFSPYTYTRIAWIYESCIISHLAVSH